MSELIQQVRDLVETVEDGGNLTLARLFYAFVSIFGMFILSKYLQWVLLFVLVSPLSILNY